MVDVREIEQLLGFGHETRSFELKYPGDLRDKAYVSKIARAAMAMGNLRDGGLVCLGIDEALAKQMGPGLSEQQQADWSDFDNVNDKLNRHADPAVAFTLHPLQLSNNARVVIISVSEFHDTPHICKKDHPGELQAGLTYVRPRGKPQSVAVPSSTDMRDLLDLAITKGVRDFVRRAGAAGIEWTTAPTAEETEAAAFQREYDVAWAEQSEVVHQILTAGHFDIAIRPGPYDVARVSPADLEQLIRGNAVSKRGWPVPFVGQRPLQRHEQWIGQDDASTIVPHCEAWRAFTSGQFLQRRVMATDTETSDRLRPWTQEATGAVAVWDVLLYFIEVTELAARIATATEATTIAIHAGLGGIAGRQLISGTYRRDFADRLMTDTDRLDTTVTLATSELVAEPHRVGIRMARDMFAKFGIDFSEALLDDWQDEVFGRSR